MGGCTEDIKNFTLILLPFLADFAGVSILIIYKKKPPDIKPQHFKPSLDLDFHLSPSCNRLFPTKNITLKEWVIVFLKSEILSLSFTFDPFSIGYITFKH